MEPFSFAGSNQLDIPVRVRMYVEVSFFEADIDYLQGSVEVVEA